MLPFPFRVIRWDYYLGAVGRIKVLLGPEWVQRAVPQNIVYLFHSGEVGIVGPGRKSKHILAVPSEFVGRNRRSVH
jgi:hypothetical protein